MLALQQVQKRGGVAGERIDRPRRLRRPRRRRQRDALVADDPEAVEPAISAVGAENRGAGKPDHAAALAARLRPDRPEPRKRPPRRRRLAPGGAEPDAGDERFERLAVARRFGADPLDENGVGRRETRGGVQPPDEPRRRSRGRRRRSGGRLNVLKRDDRLRRDKKGLAVAAQARAYPGDADWLQGDEIAQLLQPRRRARRQIAGEPGEAA